MTVLDRINVSRFEQDGCLVVTQLLDVGHEIKPLLDEYAVLIDEMMTRWHVEGKLDSTYAELPTVERLTRALDAGISYGGLLDIALPTKGVTLDTPIHLGPAVFNLLRSPRLLDVAEAILGPEIYCHPFHHTRIKPPERAVPQDGRRGGLVGTTPWHQDQAALLPEADESRILTVWFPLTPATVENGCLTVMPRSHRSGLVDHCLSSVAGVGVHIPDQAVRQEDSVAVPMEPGDVIFLHHQTMHASLPNLSDDLRWSLDLRYSVIGQPTGRPMFPGFVARSRSHPERELRDPNVWAGLWRSARARMAADNEPRIFNRWSPDGAACEV